MRCHDTANIANAAAAQNIIRGVSQDWLSLRRYLCDLRVDITIPLFLEVCRVPDMAKHGQPSTEHDPLSALK